MRLQFQADMQSFLVAKGCLINKKSRITQHTNFLDPSKVNDFEATSHDKLIPSFKRNDFFQYLRLRKNTMVSWNCNLRRRWLADTSANHATQSTWNASGYEGTFVPHIDHIAYCISSLAIVHMYQEQYSLYTICYTSQRTYLESLSLLVEYIYEFFFKAFFCWYECISAPLFYPLQRVIIYFFHKHTIIWFLQGCRSISSCTTCLWTSWNWLHEK